MRGSAAARSRWALTWETCGNALIGEIAAIKNQLLILHKLAGSGWSGLDWVRGYWLAVGQYQRQVGDPMVHVLDVLVSAV